MTNPTAAEEFSQRVLDYLRKEDRTIGWLSKRSGIADSTLRRQLVEKPNVLSFVNVVAISRTTGVEVQR